MVENQDLHREAEPPEVPVENPEAVAEPEPTVGELEQDASTAPADEAVLGAEAQPSARLILKRGGTETDFVFEFRSPATVGRFDNSVGPIDVDLSGLDEGKYVSRKHARITCENGAWRISDLQSSNGTYVLRDDFERIEEAELNDGDEIALGNARFVFRTA